MLFLIKFPVFYFKRITYVLQHNKNIYFFCKKSLYTVFLVVLYLRKCQENAILYDFMQIFHIFNTS